MLKTKYIFVSIFSVFIAFMIGSMFFGAGDESAYNVLWIHPDGEVIDSKSFDSKFDLDLPILTKEGHTFLGWYEEQTKIEEGSFERSLVLVAKFELTKYTLTFSSDDVDTVSAYYEQEPILPIPNRVGYIFIGWYANEALTEAFTGVVKSSQTLYPKFEALGDNSFAHYYLSEFDGLVLNKIVDKDQTVELPILEEEGYTFIGWRASDTGLILQANAVVNSNAVFVAVFESLVKTFTISFDASLAESFETIEVKEGDIVELPEAPYLFGYNFVGWVTDIVFDGFNVSSRVITTTFEATKDMTLYANFDYMIPSASIFYQPLRYGNQVLGYVITEIDYDSDEMIDYFILPQTYLGLPVVGISNYAFDGINYLNEVFVPEGYIEIGDGAFSNSSITKIHLPMSLEVIGSYAFNESKIETVIFADNIKLNSINYYAFAFTTKLKSIHIPDSVLFIGNEAFYDSAIETITFNETSQLRSINNSAFNRSQLETIDLPKTLENIGESAFRKTNLKTITFKENVKTISSNAFDGSLIEEAIFDFPEGITYLDKNIFRGTPLLMAVGVLFIDNLAFGYDENLNVAGFDVTIPLQINFIANNAFSGAKINVLTFETTFVEKLSYTFSYSTIQTITNLPRSNAFTDTFSSTTVVNGGELIVPNDALAYNYMFNYANMSNVDIVFNPIVENVSNYSMFSHARIKSLTIGDKTKHLSPYFLARTQLSHLEILASNLYVDNDALSFRNTTTYELSADTKFIPVHQHAFRDIQNTTAPFVNVNGYLTFGNVLVSALNVSSNDLVIPNGIDVIATYSISRSFISIDLNETKYLLSSVFQRFSFSYTVNPIVTIPSTVNYVSPGFLRDYVERPLTFVVEGFENQVISEIHFNSIDKFSGYYQRRPFDSLGFKRVGNLIYDYDVTNFGRDVVIPEGIAYIASNTFSNLNITSISYTTPIEYAGYNAFSYNKELQNIIVPKHMNFNTLYEIYEDIEAIPRLDDFEFTDFSTFSLMNFEDLARRANLKPDQDGFLIFNNTLIKYFGNAKNVVIPEGVMYIYKNAFSWNLVESITLPNSLKAIGEEAFSYAPRLREFIYEDTLVLDYIGENVVRHSTIKFSSLPQARTVHSRNTEMHPISFLNN